MSNEMLAVANTLKAGWFELLFANLFGVKQKYVDEAGFKVTLSKWKGRIYFLDFVDTKVEATIHANPTE